MTPKPFFMDFIRASDGETVSVNMNAVELMVSNPDDPLQTRLWFNQGQSALVVQATLKEIAARIEWRD